MRDVWPLPNVNLICAMPAAAAPKKKKNKKKLLTRRVGGKTHKKSTKKKMPEQSPRRLQGKCLRHSAETHAKRAEGAPASAAASLSVPFSRAASGISGV